MIVAVATPDYVMGGAAGDDKPFETVRVQFDMYVDARSSDGASEDEISDFDNAVVAAYHYATPTIAGYTVHRMEKQQLIPWAKEEKQDFWRYTRDFLLEIQAT
jgi:hypothetical protein